MGRSWVDVPISSIPPEDYSRRGVYIYPIGICTTWLHGQICRWFAVLLQASSRNQCNASHLSQFHCILFLKFIYERLRLELHTQFRKKYVQIHLYLEDILFNSTAIKWVTENKSSLFTRANNAETKSCMSKN